MAEANEPPLDAADEASRLLRPYVWRRVDAALRATRTGATYYLHDGR
jgi:hypothetical protein